MYFASRRAGGLGGTDIYRSRVSGDAPTAPVNLGPEVNSTGDETDPAVRMAGFHLLFNSTRDSAAGLFSAKSKRVVREFDYSKMPPGEWVRSNLVWLIAAALALVAFIYLAIRALRPVPVEETPTAPKEAAGAPTT
jgi:hypothetical protein